MRSIVSSSSLRSHVSSTKLLGQQPKADEQLQQRRDLARVVGRVLIGQARHEAAQEPDDVLGALDVAAEPEQVFGDAAGELRGGRLDAASDPRRTGVRRRSTGPSASIHVSLLLPPRCIETIGTSCGARHARQAARHHRERVAGGGDIGPEDDRPWLEAVPVPHRRARERHVRLRGEVLRPGANRRGELVSFARAELSSEDRVLLHEGKRGLDDELVEMLDDVVAIGRLAAPPGRRRRKPQLLAEQIAAERWQKRKERGRLDHARAERVGDDDVAGADGIDQPGDAEEGVAAQLERIAEAVVEAPEDHVDAAEGLRAS